jgi:zinc protease
VIRRPVSLKLLPLALAASFAMTSFTARAEPGVDEPPLPGTPKAVTIPVLQEARLPNGVRVVVAPRHELPLVTVALYLNVGAETDPTGRAGLASLTGALRTKGALVDGKALNATQIAQRAEALGSTLDSSTDWNGSALTMTVATPQLEAATSLIVDSTLHPTLSNVELQRLREQTSDSLQLKMSDPMALAGLVARRAWWGDSVYGGSTTPASLARISRRDVQNFARVQLRPEWATLLITGDVTLEQAKALAQRELGSWKVKGKAPKLAQPEPAAPATSDTVLVNLPGAGQSGVVVVAPTVPYDNPQRRVAQVAAAVLGGGYSARLNEEVRIKRGLSYGAMAGIEFQSVGGAVTARTQTQNATAAQVVQIVRDQVSGIAANPPGPAELEARKAALVGDIGREVETTAGLAGLALGLIGHHAPLTDAQKIVPEIQAVTGSQVQSYAASQWAPSALRTVVVGDMSKSGEGLKAVDRHPLILQSTQLNLESAGLSKR